MSKKLPLKERLMRANARARRYNAEAGEWFCLLERAEETISRLEKTIQEQSPKWSESAANKQVAGAKAMLQDFQRGWYRDQANLTELIRRLCAVIEASNPHAVELEEARQVLKPQGYTQ